MRTQIIQIGNSQGVRIPKVLLEESRITAEVDIELHPDGLLLKNAKKPRSGWDDAFRKAADAEDENAEFPHSLSGFDRKDWQW